MTRKQIAEWISDAINQKSAGEQEGDIVIHIRAYHASHIGFEIAVADGTTDQPRHFVLDLRQPR